MMARMDIMVLQVKTVRPGKMVNQENKVIKVLLEIRELMEKSGILG